MITVTTIERNHSGYPYLAEYSEGTFHEIVLFLDVNYGVVLKSSDWSVRGEGQIVEDVDEVLYKHYSGKLIISND